MSFARVVYLFALAICLSPLSGPPLALALGLAVALLVRSPFPDASKRFQKPLLQTSVVLLGFTMNLPVVLRAGFDGMAFAAVTISGTLLLGMWLGHLLGIQRRLSALLAVGTAICGGSAIAAAGSVMDAEESEMTVAIGTVFILNAVALYLFPPLGHLLGLSQGQFGTWAGVAIHDISSVVGAASHFGFEALQTATAVKLSRALWIIPVTMAVAHWAHLLPGRSQSHAAASPSDPAERIAATSPSDPAALGAVASPSDPAALPAAASPSNPAPPTVRRAPFPLFIGLFLVASLLRSLLPGATAIEGTVARLATTGMTLTLFLIGSSLSPATLKKVGWRPLAQGTVLWIGITLASLVAVRHLP